MNSLFKINLNDCICLYNHEINIQLSKQKSIYNYYNGRRHYVNSTVKKHQIYALCLYTIGDNLMISFDKNEKLRLVWYDLLSKLCNKLYGSLRIYQVRFKIKSRKQNEFINKLLKNSRPIVTRKGYYNSRVCFIDNNNDYVYLVVSNTEIENIYEKLNLNIEINDENNLIKFNTKHIKRIGHDKSNKFFIELGKRSIYGQIMFIFKCLNCDISNFLHRKTCQLIEKCSNQESQCVRGCSSNTNTRLSSFSSFLSTKYEKENSSTLKRCYTLFTQNSSKIKTYVSDVFKRLSLSKLTNSSEILSSSKISNESISSSKSCNFSKYSYEGDYSNVSSVSVNVDNCLIPEEDTYVNERFQCRSKTIDNCNLLNSNNNSIIKSIKSISFINAKFLQYFII